MMSNKFFPILSALALAVALTTALTVLSMSSPLFAYTYNKATVEPLSVVMEKPAEAMKTLDTPLAIRTLLKNSGQTALDVDLTFSTIETLQFEGATGTDQRTLVKQVTIPGNGETFVDIAVVGRTGTLDWHYPVYLVARWIGGGKTNRLEAVLPIESNIRPNPHWPTNNPMLGKIVENKADLPLNTIPAGSGLSLASLTTYRAFWNLDKEKTSEKLAPLHFEPVGWSGSSKESAASVHRQTMLRGGVSRQSLNMHPPYRKGPGAVGVDYRIKLPDTTPITFTGYGAMRDVDLTKDRPTDGVTFYLFADLEGTNIATMEKHVVGTDWTPLEFDLSDFAGKEIQLRLVSDPGPKRNTICDSCYWGDPMIFAGKKPTFADPEALRKQQDELQENCVDSMKSGRPATPHTRILPLSDGQRAVIVFGENGLIDGKIALGRPDKFVVYDGVQISVKDQPIARWPTTLAAGRWVLDNRGTPDYSRTRIQPHPRMSWTWSQEIAVGTDKATMNYTLKSNGPALQISIDCSEPTWITSIQMGPTDNAADRIYYGHGYCIVKPKQFTVGADGHRMSTSHVGMDYPSGVSVLLASTVTPVSLTVDSDRKIATPVIRPGTTLSLLPGDKGAFDCAVRYRAINPKKAAPGVKTKAGRFCFDIWGGTAKRHLEIIDSAIRYGVTDSLFIVHSWQRYGYDNRLPDIWPPNPRFGTLADMQETLKRCEQAGILYGLHDNYIDIYPDADGYSSDTVSFNGDGQPRKAWFNRGIQARSYQFRPDTFLPFLNRNFDRMLPELPQSCYFVDVFSSKSPVDYYDKDGTFHSRTETNRYWGECFDVIRDRLTKVSRDRQNLSAEEKKEFFAPSISEAGHDSLIGHLDGADCQFMYVAKEPGGEFRTVIDCDDIARVPWYDAVNHTNFSLHGVGYSGRYESGRGRLLHGIESDDYLTSEVLTGHALMVDSPSAMRGAVRKYRLLQPTIRRLADSEIDSVRYVDGDIHRLEIVWKSNNDGRTTTVYVNRSERDWTVSDRDNPALAEAGLSGTFVLPPFGFLADGPAGIATIFRNENGDVAEMSCSGRRIFVNGRQRIVDGLLPIEPSLKPGSFRRLDGNRFQCDLLWNAKSGTPIDYSIFVHLVPVDPKLQGSKGEGIQAVYGCKRTIPTTAWSGQIVTPLNPAAIPNDAPAGKYRLLVGLWNPKDGSRPSLMGQAVGNSRYSVGILDIVRDEAGRLVEIGYEEDRPKIDPFESRLRQRLAPPGRAIRFGRLASKGAFLWDASRAGKIVVTPLPDEPDTEISFDNKGLLQATVVAVDADGNTIREVSTRRENGGTAFQTKQGEFQYILETAPVGTGVVY